MLRPGDLPVPTQGLGEPLAPGVRPGFESPSPPPIPRRASHACFGRGLCSLVFCLLEELGTFLCALKSRDAG